MKGGLAGYFRTRRSVNLIREEKLLSFSVSYGEDVRCGYECDDFFFIWQMITGGDNTPSVDCSEKIEFVGFRGTN